MMLFVDNKNEHDPALNLALEEYVQKQAQVQGDLLLLYINEPSVIIGRHQNIFVESNLPFLEEHNIQVVRRLSGGGTVFHDPGNLNFSIITHYHQETFHQRSQFSLPALRCLQQLGVAAELNERNDIVIAGKKVSGTAQYISLGRMVYHGTLLFSSNLDHVSEALLSSPGEIQSKGIKSVRSPVTNIRDHLAEKMDINTFRNHLLHSFFENEPSIPFYVLTEQDWAKIHQLADERYRSWEWTYGRSPEFSITKRKLFAMGEIIARIEVKEGRIQSARFSGEYFDKHDPTRLERRLAGLRYDRQEITAALQAEQSDPLFQDLDLLAFCQFLR